MTLELEFSNIRLLLNKGRMINLPFVHLCIMFTTLLCTIDVVFYILCRSIMLRNQPVNIVTL